MTLKWRLLCSTVRLDTSCTIIYRPCTAPPKHGEIATPFDALSVVMPTAHVASFYMRVIFMGLHDTPYMYHMYRVFMLRIHVNSI